MITTGCDIVPVKYTAGDQRDEYEATGYRIKTVVGGKTYVSETLYKELDDAIIIRDEWIKADGG